MKTDSRKLAHWVGLIAVVALIPFIANDIIHLRLWTASWDIWALAAGFTVLACAIAYGLGWGLVKLLARLFQNRAI